MSFRDASSPDAPAGPALPRAPRNHVVDAARAASVVIVVVFHSLLYQVRLVDGRPELVPWAAPHWPWWLLTWIFMCIPVFFIAGGFAHALLVDRMHREGTGYARFLANRGRRLAGPLLLFVTVLAAASTAAAWLGRLPDAVTLTRQLMQLLWFLTVYLVIVAAAPAAVRAHDRWGWRPMAVLAVLAAAVDAFSFATATFWWRNINLFVVWPLVHQLGIAYQRGWFRSGPAWRAWLPLLAGASGIVALVFGLGYPGSSVGFADIPIANVQPPTLGMAFLGLAQCGALGLVERSGWLRRLPRRVERTMSVANALMMTVYLWHIGGIALAAGGLFGLSEVWPAAAGVLLAQPTVTAASLLVVAALVPLIGRIEFRLIAPLGAHPDAAPAIAAYALLVAGTALVWQFGTVLHPAAPWSTLGVLLVWGGVALMRRAASG